MSIDTAAAAYVASIPTQRAEQVERSSTLTPSAAPDTNCDDDDTFVLGRWQAAVAMLAGLAAGALIVAGIVLPW